jgi:S-adenosylmethionine-dependent methyltransferase
MIMPLTDRNFDKMADKFESRIYGTFKGELRLELLQEDLSVLREGAPLDVWDAGCGSGRMALWFAQSGHRVTGCDISQKMIDLTRVRFTEAGEEIALYHRPAQELVASLPPQDLILFHAVIEWLADPIGTLETLAQQVKPGGYLSLMFFNHHALIYRNAMRGEWRLKYLLEESWWGKGKNLTPPYPQKPEELVAWLEAHGFAIQTHTGIRVFHDYMHDEARDNTNMEELHELEQRYCRGETFRNMGRYVHLLAQRR